VHLKNLSFLLLYHAWYFRILIIAKSKIGIFCQFFRANPTVLGVLMGFCWAIGVTAALFGRLLPSDGHKLVKKPRNLGPKVPQTVHFLAERILI
jgi:hypothetical protein